MKELVDTLDGAADGAFIVDEDLEIVYANSSGVKILGYELEEFVESYCYRILNGRDEKRRLVCRQNCIVADRILSGNPVADFDLSVAADPEDRRWINMSVFRHTEPDRDASYIVHLFRDITQKKKEVRLVERLVEIAKNYHEVDIEGEVQQEAAGYIEKLTAREREVLGRLADGASTREISQQLSISIHTTRNHIQHILQKLNVHTRLEAVIYALDHGLIDQE